MVAVRRGPRVIARYLPWAGAACLVLLTGCGTSAPPAGGTVSLGTVIPGTGSATATSPTALGTELVRHYFKLLVGKDDVALGRLLAPSFHAAGPNGTTIGKAAYLASLPDVRSFTVSDVTGREYLGVLVVTYRLRLVERVGGTDHLVGPRRRLTVFAWQHGAWRIAAHAYPGASGRKN
ncbi:MAG TPA: nuclear transport factor 2 family protein [Streptosporangiaceae bacterium]